MDDNQTVKKWLKWFIYAYLFSLAIVVMLFVSGDNKILRAILTVISFVFLYKSMSRLREFHRNYVIAFRCLIYCIIINVAAFALAILCVLQPHSALLFLWIDVVLERAARPLFSVLELYYVCKATEALAAEAGYTKVAAFGSGVKKIYLLSGCMMIFYSFLRIWIPFGKLMGVYGLLSVGLNFVSTILSLVFIYRAQKRIV